MSIINATDENFSTETHEGLILVDFWAVWCGPCKMISPVLDELSSDLGSSLKIVKLDVDKNPDTAAQYNIMSIPTLLIMKDGIVKKQLTGFQPKEALLTELNTYL